uniref:Uncharacterized protein n=1 Tax=Anguilla anguilla TaxID=7936 RepID=A0A0E9XEW4_ANGAN
MGRYSVDPLHSVSPLTHLLLLSLGRAPLVNKQSSFGKSPVAALTFLPWLLILDLETLKQHCVFHLRTQGYKGRCIW